MIYTLLYVLLEDIEYSRMNNHPFGILIFPVNFKTLQHSYKTAIKAWHTGTIFSRLFFEIIFIILPENRFYDISCKLSPWDNLHEMSNLVFWEK